MILSKETAIAPNESAGELHDRLMSIGSEATVETLHLIANDTISTTIQEDTDDIKTAYKLNKENCKIDLSKSGLEVYNLIRGLSPYPSAWCFIKDGDQEWNVKIYEAKLASESHTYPIGTLLTNKKR